MSNWNKKWVLSRENVCKIFKEFHADQPEKTGLYDFQIDAATALHNRLCSEPFAFLADEVGMGKTYTALCVANLLLERKKDARIIILTPRKIVSEQWIKKWSEFPDLFLANYHKNLCNPVDKKPVREVFECSTSSMLLDGIKGSNYFITVTSVFSFRYFKSYCYNENPLNIKKSKKWESYDTFEDYFLVDYLIQLNDSLKKSFGESKIDLLIIDESQMLRNDYNLTNKTLATILGLKSDAIANGKEDKTNNASALVDRVLFMSATPMHKTENNLYKQVAYATPANVSAENIKTDYDKEQYMIQRNRTYIGKDKQKYSRYFYRNFLPESVQGKGDNPTEQEIFLAVTQQLLNKHHLGKGKARFEMGFLETFESFGDTFDPDYESAEDEVPQKPVNSDAIMTEDADKVKKTEAKAKTGDSWVVDTIKENWDVVNSSNCLKRIPHPKQEYFDTRFVLKELLEQDTPKKAVVFVRRIKGTQQLARAAIYQFYEFLKQQIETVPLDLSANPLWQDLRAVFNNKNGVKGLEDFRTSNKIKKYRENKKYLNELVKLAGGIEGNELQRIWAQSSFLNNNEGLVLVILFADLVTGNHIDEEGLKKRWEDLKEQRLLKRTSWRVKQFFNRSIFNDIKSQVLSREDITLSDEQLINTSVSFTRKDNFAVAVSSSVGSDRIRAIKNNFNTPLFPDIIIATDMMREGVDLHLFCDKMMHYGLAWSTGDLEQRIGRCDRCRSRLERKIATLEGKEKIKKAYPVFFPYVERTVDSKQVSKILSEKINIEEKYLGNYFSESTGKMIVDSRKEYSPPEMIIDKYKDIIKDKQSILDNKQKISDYVVKNYLENINNKKLPSGNFTVPFNLKEWNKQIAQEINRLLKSIITEDICIEREINSDDLSAVSCLRHNNSDEKLDVLCRASVLGEEVRIVLVLRKGLSALKTLKRNNTMENLQVYAANCHPAVQLSLDTNDKVWIQKSLLLGTNVDAQSFKYKWNISEDEMSAVVNDLFAFLQNYKKYTDNKIKTVNNWKTFETEYQLKEKNIEADSMDLKFVSWLRLKLQIKKDFETRELWRMNHRFEEIEFRKAEGGSSILFFHPLSKNGNDLDQVELDYMCKNLLSVARLVDDDVIEAPEEE